MWQKKASTATSEKGVSCFPLPKVSRPPSTRRWRTLPIEVPDSLSRRTRPGRKPENTPGVACLPSCRKAAGTQAWGRRGSRHTGLGVSPLSLLPTTDRLCRAHGLRHTQGSARANSQGRLLRQKVQSWHETRSLHPHQRQTPSGDSQAQPRPHGLPPGGAGGHGCFPCPIPACKGPWQPGKAAALPLPQAPRICLIEH